MLLAINASGFIEHLCFRNIICVYVKYNMYIYIYIYKECTFYYIWVTGAYVYIYMFLRLCIGSYRTQVSNICVYGCN